MTNDFVVLEEYDPTWPQKAQNEIQLLQSTLPLTVGESIQHIGSTAVPGLPAKPVIDLMMSVEDIGAAKNFVPLIEVLGYAYWRDNPKKDRLFFVKGLPEKGGAGRTHHLHLFQKNSYDYFARPLFRDYLIVHPEIKAAYAQLKNELVLDYGTDREAYTAAKTSFVNHISQQAMLSIMRFKPLSMGDFCIMHDWFNRPHVQEFYSLRSWTQDEVEKKLIPYLLKTTAVKGFVVSLDTIPIAYFQYCHLTYNPWPDQDLPDSVIEKGVGVDFFMGEFSFTGKGFGSKMINAFLSHVIWPTYEYCVADPDVRNLRSIKTLKKCGFTEHKQIKTTDSLGNPVTLQLMIKKKSKEKNDVTSHPQ